MDQKNIVDDSEGPRQLGYVQDGRAQSKLIWLQWLAQSGKGVHVFNVVLCNRHWCHFLLRAFPFLNHICCVIFWQKIYVTSCKCETIERYFFVKNKIMQCLQPAVCKCGFQIGGEDPQAKCKRRHVTRQHGCFHCIMLLLHVHKSSNAKAGFEDNEHAYSFWFCNATCLKLARPERMRSGDGHVPSLVYPQQMRQKCEN